MAGAADQIKRVTLELGGKSANIVFADADLEKAAASAPYGVFENAGQDCCARSRILVQRSIYADFAAKYGQSIYSFVTEHRLAQAHARYLERKAKGGIPAVAPIEPPASAKGCKGCNSNVFGNAIHLVKGAGKAMRSILFSRGRFDWLWL